MSENLEKKSADFVRSLIKFLCIFCPGPRQNRNPGRGPGLSL